MWTIFVEYEFYYLLNRKHFLERFLFYDSVNTNLISILYFFIYIKYLGNFKLFFYMLSHVKHKNYMYICMGKLLSQHLGSGMNHSKFIEKKNV